MHLNTYLSFNGQCEAAFTFYEKCLNGKFLSKFTYAGSPAAGQVPADYGDKLMHAVLKVGDYLVMGADAPPQYHQTPKCFSVNIAINDEAEAERIFNALAQNGQVKMPLQKTFWAAKFGMLIDQFGIPWMINCEGNVNHE